MIDFRPLQPVLLTAEEAATYLRLDEDRDVEKAVRALYRYVDRHELSATVIGVHRRFSIRELDRFIDAKTAAGASDWPSDSNGQLAGREGGK